MAIIRYTSTKLTTLNKEGIIKPDANGYYQCMIGALNIDNSVGDRYVLDTQVRRVFEGDSILMRRVKAGVVKGEMGHPKRGTMTTEQYIDRMYQIYEQETAVHFAEICLDTDFGKNNPRFGMPNLVAINARVGPSGPFGAVWKKGMDNREENMCFSLRGVTNDVQVGGQWQRSISTAITWDVVTEPGLFVANKFDSPALESIDNTVTLAQLHRAIQRRELLPGLAKEDSTSLMLESYRILLSTANATPVSALNRAIRDQSALKAWSVGK